LRWALDRHHVELPEAAIQNIVNNYHKLRAYPDVINALKSLKQRKRRRNLKRKIVRP
jgi:2-haloacid dehalogenase